MLVVLIPVFANSFSKPLKIISTADFVALYNALSLDTSFADIDAKFTTCPDPCASNLGNIELRLYRSPLIFVSTIESHDST